MMHKLGIVVTAALVLGAVTFAAGPAAARGASKNTKVCKALQSVSSDISKLDSSTSGKTFDKDAAKAIAKAYGKAAKAASGDLKSALKTIAGIFKRVGKGDSFVTVIQETGQKYLRAATTSAKFYTRNCLPSNLTVPSSP